MKKFFEYLVSAVLTVLLIVTLYHQLAKCLIDLVSDLFPH